jgi:hypothetical protein
MNLDVKYLTDSVGGTVVGTGTEQSGELWTPAQAAENLAVYPQAIEGILVIGSTPENDETGEQNPTTLAHGSVEVGRELVTWTAEVPREPKYDGIAFIVPGYLGVQLTSESLRTALARQGIATVSFSPAREGEESFLETFVDPQGLHVETLGRITRSLVDSQAILKKYVPGGNELAFDKFILLAHSMGGFAAPRHALTMPSGIHAIYGLATTGFGSPTLADLAKDVPRGMVGSIIHELVPAARQGDIPLNWQNLADMRRYIGRLRFIFEGLSCVSARERFSVVEDVGKLRDLAVPYIYHAFKWDILVRAREEKLNGIVTKLIKEERWGHFAPQAKAEKLAPLIAHTIFSLP